MTQNALRMGPEIIGIVVGAVVLLIFALAFALPQRSRVLPGSQGHREADEDGRHEEVRPDGYIDSFNKEIEEAGGGLPWVVMVAVPGVLIVWVIYLVLQWTP
ncbi:MAG: hypothetical protein ABH877_00180 [bacterium]